MRVCVGVECYESLCKALVYERVYVRHWYIWESVCKALVYERVYVRHWYIWESVWKVFAYDMRLCTRKVLNHKIGCKVLQGMRVYKALNVMIV